MRNIFGFFVLCLLFSVIARISWSAVSLLPHQSYPIDYLTKNSEVKGLLIYHSLGSGKTFLSLGLAEKYPEKKIFVLMPRFLKSNWTIQMDQFGIGKSSRYTLLSFDEALENGIAEKLRGQIVIIDEVHKFVDYLRATPAVREKFLPLYFGVQGAERILALSGTPVYKDITDISYILNLVSAQDLLPYSSQLFRNEYTTINEPKSWLRGYVLESKWMDLLIPTIGIGASVLLFPPNMIIVGAVGSMALLPTIRSVVPVSTVHFREFDQQRVGQFTEKYASFYEVNFAEDENYPRKTIEFVSVPYSEAQIKFFLSFANLSLQPDQLAMLLADSESPLNERSIKVSADVIQASFKDKPGAGCEIGNLYLDQADQPKFLKVLEKVKKSKGPVVVYSNYFHNGIKLFEAFMHRHGYAGKTKVIHPDLKLEEQVAAIKDYNQGKIPVLLIHPEITEGISLNGTDQLHILEPIVSSALQDQIIGRVVRYQSHKHLPKDLQRVEVFVWYNEIDLGKWRFGFVRDEFIRRDFYLKNYREVNENTWSGAPLDIDPTYRRKERSPDQLVIDNLHRLDRDRGSFTELLRAHSIESVKGK